MTDHQPPFLRRDQLALFGGYDSPVLSVTMPVEGPDVVSPARSRGIPPFAVVLHALAAASLDIPEFRTRLVGGKVETIESLTISYTVVGQGDRLNFSTFGFDADFAVFLARYLEDREPARRAAQLRLHPMDHRAFLFATCLPWMSFTALQHPVARFVDCSIPLVAVGKWETASGRMSFPLNLQVHHGLVDGIHIARFVEAFVVRLEAWA